MKICFLLLTFILCHNTATAQRDSIALEVFVLSPFNNQTFDLSRKIGVKIGNKTSEHKFSIAYSCLTNTSNWSHFYNDKSTSWTNNVLILYDYSDTTPARSRNGQIETISHGITLGWSHESVYGNVSIYGGIGLSVFVNHITVFQTSSNAFISKGMIDILPQGISVAEAGLRYKDIKITSDVKLRSLVPAVNFESGIVFKCGANFKLIPILNWGLYLHDNRITSGELYARRTNLRLDLRPALQFSYEI